MSWIERKKLALIPLFRQNADPPDQIPADWENQILRRVVFDPDPTTGADRSLRAYIGTASSGRADLDAVVMKMQTVDHKDFPDGVLEDRLGPQLRAQGFDAGGIVWCTDPSRAGGGSGGFWAQFNMGSNTGAWSWAFMVCLTEFSDAADSVNMGAFDNLGLLGTHPTAYTKTAIGWLDAQAIAQHTGGTESYNLHSVGLVQPPPSGRVAAVRIGSRLPYLMVEARQRVDQFDRGIPSEGVIVYRIQAEGPHGGGPDQQPIQLLTASALTVGQAFTSDTHVKVQVISALPGGFAVNVHDPKTTVPDVVEMSASIAANQVNAAGLVPKFTGPHQANSWVFSQKPAAGDVVNRGAIVTMALRTGPLPT